MNTTNKMRPEPLNSSEPDMKAFLSEKNADIAAWTVSVDPFELGLRMETYEATLPQTKSMRECSMLPSSRLSKLPLELLAQVEALIQRPTQALIEAWSTYQACCTRTCRHHLRGLVALVHYASSFKAHRKTIREFNRKIFKDRRARNPTGYRWGQTLKCVSQAFGIRPVISQRQRPNAPQNIVEAFVTIPIGCRNFGRDCTDAYEWLFDGENMFVWGEAPSDLVSKAEKERVQHRCMVFKQAIGHRHLALSDEGLEQWDKCKEWKEPALRLFRTVNNPRGTGASKRA